MPRRAITTTLVQTFCRRNHPANRRVILRRLNSSKVDKILAMASKHSPLLCDQLFDLWGERLVNIHVLNKLEFHRVKTERLDLLNTIKSITRFCRDRNPRSSKQQRFHKKSNSEEL